MPFPLYYPKTNIIIDSSQYSLSSCLGKIGLRLQSLSEISSTTAIRAHTSKLVSTLTNQLRDILKIVPSCDAKLPDEVFGSTFQVATIFAIGTLLVRSAEVCVT